jgi:hypothetical protein
MLICLHKYSSIRHTHITEEIRKTIVVREEEVSSAITLTDTQLDVVERNLGEIRLRETGRRQGQDEEDVRNAVQQMEEERAALDCLRKLLETLLPKAREDAVVEAASKSQKRVNHRSTTMTFGSNHNGFQAGIINGGVVSGLNFRAT